MNDNNYVLSRPVLLWLLSLDLTFAVRQLRTTVANGFFVAEILNRFYPDEVQMHTYSTSTSRADSADNWERVSRVLARHNCPISPSLITDTSNKEIGAAERLVTELHAWLTKQKPAEPKGRPVTRSATPFGNSTQNLGSSGILFEKTAEPRKPLLASAVNPLLSTMRRADLENSRPVSRPTAAPAPAAAPAAAAAPAPRTSVVTLLDRISEQFLLTEPSITALLDPRKDKFGAICSCRTVPEKLLISLFDSMSEKHTVNMIADFCAASTTDYYVFASRVLQAIAISQTPAPAAAAAAATAAATLLTTVHTTIVANAPAAAGVLVHDLGLRACLQVFPQLCLLSAVAVVGALCALLPPDTPPQSFITLVHDQRPRVEAAFVAALALSASSWEGGDGVTLLTAPATTTSVASALASLSPPDRHFGIIALRAIATCAPAAAAPALPLASAAADAAVGLGLHGTVLEHLHVLVQVCQNSSDQSIVDELTSWLSRYAEMSELSSSPLPAACVARIVAQCPQTFPAVVNAILTPTLPVASVRRLIGQSLVEPGLPKHFNDAIADLPPFFETVPPSALINLIAATAAADPSSAQALPPQAVLALEAAVAAHALVDDLSTIIPALSALCDHLFVALSDPSSAAESRLPLLCLLDHADDAPLAPAQSNFASLPPVQWTMAQAAQSLTTMIALLVQRAELPPPPVSTALVDLLLSALDRGSVAASVATHAVVSLSGPIRAAPEFEQLLRPVLQRISARVLAASE